MFICSAAPYNYNNCKMKLRVYPCLSLCQVTRGVFSRISNGGEDKPACKKLRKQLLCCRICQGDYVRPKVLPCLHTFCEQCLLSEVPAHSLAVTCPTCRQQSILPLEGVSALRDNVVLIRLMDAMEQLVSCAICQTGSAVSSCLDCVNSFCKPCATTHVELEPGHTIAALTASCVQLTKETSAGGEGEKSSCELMSCPKHSGQQLDLYCSECETIICATCSSRAGEHEGHPASPLASTVEEHKRLLQDLLNTVKAQLAAIQSSMDSIKSTSVSLLDNYRAAESRVRECFDMLSRTLLERKESLLNSLEATYRTKHERLAKQLRDLQEAAGGMSNSCVFTESALGRASELEMLLVRKEMTDTLARLSVNNRLQTTQIVTDELAFAESNLLNLINVVKGFGTIEPSSEQPCVACDVETSGGGLQWCYVGQESTINISVNSPQPDADPSLALTAQIASLTGGDIVTPSITRPSPGNYSVVYTAPRVGTYQIELRLGGHQVAGSPFIVLALAAGDTGEAESSSAGDAPDDFLSSKRSVSIVDNKNKVRGRGAKRPGTTPRSRSCAANLDGNMMAKMGRKGNGKGEFANPLGVCYSQGKCVVADSNNQCIQVFTNMGICKLRFGIRGSLPGQLRKPTSVATLPSGNFVVTDYDNKCVSSLIAD
jgi:tripartite motif-containing protein 2/3